ncbi:FAD-dependent monooxygenase [Streptomyces liangshanensis]|uniref:FAD-dependent oxidoreductase n=1 Tax=Streptomyces liangshanensis TaxID=2717324 RepID=A0A6G9GVH1_9ACTN|nr:FAD-dependent monooxygenase [Streptomyces liangshanensis]QIQ01927.1 FAD-dependent oxidoreductase [Streptomyces liangshanensis]
MKAPRVLVSGAGVAGPALAYWLARRGATVTVVEVAPRLREAGAAVDFRGSQTELLRRMGILDAVSERRTGMGDIAFVDAAGRRRATLPSAFLSGEIEILRGDLTRILYEAGRDTVEYVFGDRITSLTEGTGGVGATFAKGAPRTFDLVVGADGTHSGVREITFGEEERFTRHLGYHIAGMTAPNHLGLRRTGVLYNEPGRGLLVTQPADESTVWASFGFAAGPVGRDARDPERLKAFVAEHCAGMGWESAVFLDRLAGAPDFFHSPLALIELGRWSSGRTVLLGDAAWSAGVGGLGTALGLLGAYVLAGEIGAADNPATAFASYERIMRPYVAEGHAQARRIGPFLVPRRIRARDLLVRVAYSRLLGGVVDRVTTGSLERFELTDYDV